MTVGSCANSCSLCANTHHNSKRWKRQNLKHSTVRHSPVCRTVETTRGEQTHPKDRSVKDSVERRRLLWFSSGLICSPLMHFCGSSHSFLREANPHLHSHLSPASPHAGWWDRGVFTDEVASHPLLIWPRLPVAGTSTAEVGPV